MTIAHVGALPVEELLPMLAGGVVTMLGAWVRSAMLAAKAPRRRSRPVIPSASAVAGGPATPPPSNTPTGEIGAPAPSETKPRRPTSTACLDKTGHPGVHRRHAAVPALDRTIIAGRGS